MDLTPNVDMLRPEVRPEVRPRFDFTVEALKSAPLLSTHQLDELLRAKFGGNLHRKYYRLARIAAGAPHRTARSDPHGNYWQRRKEHAPMVATPEEKYAAAVQAFKDVPDASVNAVFEQLHKEHGSGLPRARIADARHEARSTTGAPSRQEEIIAQAAEKYAMAVHIFKETPLASNVHVLAKIQDKYGSAIGFARLAAARIEADAPRGRASAGHKQAGATKLGRPRHEPGQRKAVSPTVKNKKRFIVDLFRQNPEISVKEIDAKLKAEFGSGVHGSLVKAARKSAGLGSGHKGNRRKRSVEPQPVVQAMVVAADTQETGLTKAARALCKAMSAEGVEELSIKADGTVRIVRVARETFRV